MNASVGYQKIRHMNTLLKHVYQSVLGNISLIRFSDLAQVQYNTISDHGHGNTRVTCVWKRSTIYKTYLSSVRDQERET